MSDEPIDYSQIVKYGACIPMSTEVLMDYGVIPDTRPPRPPISRRTRLRWWWQDHSSSRVLRSRLAEWIHPDEPWGGE